MVHHSGKTKLTKSGDLAPGGKCWTGEEWRQVQSIAPSYLEFCELCLLCQVSQLAGFRPRHKLWFAHLDVEQFFVSMGFLSTLSWQAKKHDAQVIYLQFKDEHCEWLKPISQISPTAADAWLESARSNPDRWPKKQKFRSHDLAGNEARGHTEVVHQTTKFPQEEGSWNYTDVLLAGFCLYDCKNARGKSRTKTIADRRWHLCQGTGRKSCRKLPEVATKQKLCQVQLGARFYTDKTRSRYICSRCGRVIRLCHFQKLKCPRVGKYEETNAKVYARKIARAKCRATRNKSTKRKQQNATSWTGNFWSEAFGEHSPDSRALQSILCEGAI